MALDLRIVDKGLKLVQNEFLSFAWVDGWVGGRVGGWVGGRNSDYNATSWPWTLELLTKG